MAAGHAGADGEHGIQKQHAVLRPASEITAFGRLKADVVLQLLENIDQRRRLGNPVLHREAEPMRLPRAVVGVLSENDGAHVVVIGIAQGVEDVVHMRIDAARGILLLQEYAEPLIVVARKLAGQQLVPAVADMDHYFVPNRRSPASPSPGTIYACSLSFSSTAAT